MAGAAVASIGYGVVPEKVPGCVLPLRAGEAHAWRVDTLSAMSSTGVIGPIRGHLVGAFGEFWERDEVEWTPGRGRSWQMLGCLDRQNAGAIGVADFRAARGIYILFDDHGTTYVGMARGKQGLGDRLSKHDRNPPHGREWHRFSWYSFDDVVRAPEDGWWGLVARDDIGEIGAEGAAREMEALVIRVLGAHRFGQIRMGFDRGATRQWYQVTTDDTYPRGLLSRIDPGPLTDSRMMDWMNELQ